MNIDLMERELACISDIPDHKLNDAEFLRAIVTIGRTGFKEALDRLDEAERLLTALWRYGNLHQVEGVIYPETGSHKQTLEAVGDYLLRRAQEKEGAI